MRKRWCAVSLTLLLLAGCLPVGLATSAPSLDVTPTTAPAATPEEAGAPWQEEVSFDDTYTASLLDSSPIPQATLPLYYKGNWQGMTWAQLAGETGFAEADLRALNPQITEASDGTLSGNTPELLLSSAYAIPQTQEILVTVTVPDMPEPYQERQYSMPAALPREAAGVLALSYYNAEAEGQGFTCEPSSVEGYRQVVAGQRFATFSEAEAYFETIYTPGALSDLLQSSSDEVTDNGAPYYLKGAGDALLIAGYSFDHIIPQSGYTYTEPEVQPDGSLKFAGICIVVTDEEGKPLSGEEERLYYAPTKLVNTADGWRVETINPPF